jgi:hypothetical protein
LALITQTHSESEPLGATSWGGSVLLGVHVAPRLALEFEPSFAGTYSSRYTYRPGPSWTADVVASRRDTYFSFQARTRAGVLEPVIGVSYVHEKIRRHATTGGATYFDDERSDGRFAVVGGLDAAFEIAPGFHFVPTLRVVVVMRPESRGGNDPIGSDTSTGSVLFRYGAGARVTF